LRSRIVALLPLLGFAPARIQGAWHDRWGFPATAATRLSVACELLLGAFGSVSLVVETFGGRPPVPGWLSWLLPIGPLLLLEGLVRLARHLPNDEVVGSVLGLPLELAIPAPAKRTATPVAPTAVELDNHQLVLRSTECRSDWVPEGELRYRGRRWRLAAADRDGVAWRYRFEAVEDEVPEVEHRLSLVRPAGRAAADPVRAGPELGLLATTVLTAFACFASTAFQRSWSERLEIGPRTLTVLGAALELFGGFVNLHRPAVRAVPVVALLNAVLVLEGLARLAVTSVVGGPVASLLGLPFEGLARRWLRGRIPRGT
jgi:hypothetical protein